MSLACECCDLPQPGSKHVHANIPGPPGWIEGQVNAGVLQGIAWCSSRNVCSSFKSWQAAHIHFRGPASPSPTRPTHYQPTCSHATSPQPPCFPAPDPLSLVLALPCPRTALSAPPAAQDIATSRFGREATFPALRGLRCTWCCRCQRPMWGSNLRPQG